MSDSPEEIHGSHTTRKWIAEEIKRQVEPQTKLVAMMVARLDRMEKWSRSLWGNGTGPPGYLENARAEDRAWKDEMFEVVSNLKAAKLREEGKEELRKELGIQEIEEEKLADSKKTNRLARFHYWWVIAGSFIGTWILSVLHPMLKLLMENITKALH